MGQVYQYQLLLYRTRAHILFMYVASLVPRPSTRGAHVEGLGTGLVCSLVLAVRPTELHVLYFGSYMYFTAGAALVRKRSYLGLSDENDCSVHSIHSVSFHSVPFRVLVLPLYFWY